ncbi:MAG: molybdopterin-guanine dinucleotide biosynthesis protein MobB, partial [Betaproteobacteria bacterium HGW-Betaproteobacteria-21]
VATDVRLDTTLPQLDINDPQAVADFVADHALNRSPVPVPAD